MSPRLLYLLSFVLFASTTGAEEPLPFVPAANAPDAVSRIEQLGGAVRYVSRTDPALEVDFQFAGERVNDQHLQYVQTLENVAAVRLKRTAITDDGLKLLAKCGTIRRLYLEDTAITDRGLEHLATMPQLQLLNLDGTQVTDAGAERLDECTALRQLYLWKTKVTPAGILRLQQAKPKVAVVPDPARDRVTAQQAVAVAEAMVPRTEEAWKLAKQEVEEWDPKKEELKKKFEAAKKVADEARKKSDAGRQQRDESKRKADELRRKAESAEKRAADKPEDETLGKQAAEQRGAADEAKERFEEEERESQQLKSQFDELQKQSEAARQMFDRAARARDRLQTAEAARDAAVKTAEYARKRLALFP